MRQHKLVVDEVDIEQIAQHPDNPHNGDIDSIEESLAVNGLYKPLLVQRSTGYILAGNHTYIAAIRQGALQVPVIYLDVDDIRAKRIMVADNTTARKGADDEAALNAILAELYATDAGLHGTGFDYESYTRLQEDLEGPLEFDDDRDMAPERHQKAAVAVELTPNVDDDGNVTSIEIWKPDGAGFSKRDYQSIRVALGLARASKADVAALGVAQWRT